MNQEEKIFLEIGHSLNAEQGKLFGKLCFKTKKKAFVCFFEDCMVFKLNGEAHSEAFSLDGAQLFDPSKKSRPMKEWLQVSFDYQDQWAFFAKAAKDYVEAINK